MIGEFVEISVAETIGNVDGVLLGVHLCDVEDEAVVTSVGDSVSAFVGLVVGTCDGFIVVELVGDTVGTVLGNTVGEFQMVCESLGFTG